MEHKKHIFTADEKKIFMDILIKYTKHVENKQTDGQTLRMKQIAWEKIAAEYNASPIASVKMTIQQLRRLWMNLKQRKRGCLTKADHRKEGSQTSDADSCPELLIFNPVSTVEKLSRPKLNFGKIDDPLDLLSPSSSNSTPMANNRQDGTEYTSRPTSSSLNTQSVHKSPTTHLENEAYFTEKEYYDRKTRAHELHELEKQILKEKLREAKAKADLAELLLKQQQPCPSENTQPPKGCVKTEIE